MRDPIPRRIGLGVVLALIVGAILLLEQPWRPNSVVPPPPANVPAELQGLPGAADFRGATGWINTPEGRPLDLVVLRGQVVLVDFWTYSCINCIRTFPAIRAWHDAYKDDGLVIVGVHSPEFRFERDPDNVREAAQRYNLTHPIALDNDFKIWDAYHNRYWPAKYLVDQYGKIRYTHFGEGAYEETELKIRELLVEAGHHPGNQTRGQEPPVDPGFGGRTPELYAGSDQGTSGSALGNPEGYHPGHDVSYARPEPLARDRIYLVGSWYNDDDHVRATSADAKVLLVFTAAEANFVAEGPPGSCAPVSLDNAIFPAERAGRDVEYHDEGACIRLDGPRSYDFYAGPFEQHQLELHVPVGFKLYTFAFSSTQAS